VSKKIFLWVAHPKNESLCAGLADAYQAGAEAGGAQVRRMQLGDMSFDPDCSGYDEPMQPLEPCLRQWQDNINWADHLLVVHPYWWGGMPAKAKAVLDRALTPGFAFKYHRKGVAWDKLLSGKTADGIITSDTPPLLDTLLYRKPGRRVLKNQVLDFCGIKSRKIVQFGSVKTASEKTLNGWLTRSERMGLTAAAGLRAFRTAGETG